MDTVGTTETGVNLFRTSAELVLRDTPIAFDITDLDVCRSGNALVLSEASFNAGFWPLTGAISRDNMVSADSNGISTTSSLAVAGDEDLFSKIGVAPTSRITRLQNDVALLSGGREVTFARVGRDTVVQCSGQWTIGGKFLCSAGTKIQKSSIGFIILTGWKEVSVARCYVLEVSEVERRPVNVVQKDLAYAVETLANPLGAEEFELLGLDYRHWLSHLVGLAYDLPQSIQDSPEVPQCSLEAAVKPAFAFGTMHDVFLDIDKKSWPTKDGLPVSQVVLMSDLLGYDDFSRARTASPRVIIRGYHPGRSDYWGNFDVFTTLMDDDGAARFFGASWATTAIGPEYAAGTIVNTVVDRANFNKERRSRKFVKVPLEVTLNKEDGRIPDFGLMRFGLMTMNGSGTGPVRLDMVEASSPRNSVADNLAVFNLFPAEPVQLSSRQIGRAAARRLLAMFKSSNVVKKYAALPESEQPHRTSLVALMEAGGLRWIANATAGGIRSLSADLVEAPGALERGERFKTANVRSKVCHIAAISPEDGVRELLKEIGWGLEMVQDNGVVMKIIAPMVEGLAEELNRIAS